VDDITNLISAWVADRYYVDLASIRALPEIVREVFKKRIITYTDGSVFTAEQQDQQINRLAIRQLANMASYGNTGAKIWSSHQRRVHYLSLPKTDSNPLSFLYAARSSMESQSELVCIRVTVDLDGKYNIERMQDCSWVCKAD